MGESRVLLCDTSGYTRGKPSRCGTIEPRPDCDPRCGQYRQPGGYVQAAMWADEMLEQHDQRQCPGCGGWTIWVPHVAGDDLGRAGAS